MFIRPVQIHNAVTTIAVLFLLCLVSSPASARIFGDIELGYSKYDLRADGGKEMDASSFKQRYALGYQTAGVIEKGRLARYNLMLGYEWGSFDSKIKSIDKTIDETGLKLSTGHLLYEGELLVDPAELPIQFKAFSYDRTRITFLDDSLSPIPSLSSTDHMIAPGISTNILNGTHLSSGATMVFGVKNSLTNGYNRIFYYLPMILLDYREDLNRDLKSLTPVDNRTRRLAFVSLNKRDNWFHYRTTDYDDFINKDQSWKETQIQLGTIDQSLTRKWIDMTNWIKVSADGQFTKRHSLLPSGSFQEYDLNLFGIASRSNWEARSFTNFNRLLDSSGLKTERRLPLYVNGIWGPDTDWKVRLSSTESRTIRTDRSVLDDVNVAMSVRVDTFKRSPFTLGTYVSSEYGDRASVGNNVAFAAGVETASTRRFSDVYSLFASYSIKQFISDTILTGSTEYTNHIINGRFSYVPNQNWRLSLSENITVATGNNPGGVGNSLITANNNFNVSSSLNSGLNRSGDNTVNEYIRYITTASADWTPTGRLSLSLSLSEDILTQTGAANDYMTTVRQTANYQISDYSFRIENSASLRNAGEISAATYGSRGSAAYKPNRTMDTSLRYDYQRVREQGRTTTYLDLTQKLNYYLFTTSGVSRRLVEFSEEFNYNVSDNSFLTEANVARRLTLGAKYFPLSRLYVGATARYSLIDPGSVFEQVYSGVTGMNYRTMQITLDYSYAKRSGGNNAIEKRFMANFKKSF